MLPSQQLGTQRLRQLKAGQLSIASMKHESPGQWMIGMLHIDRVSEVSLRGGEIARGRAAQDYISIYSTHHLCADDFLPIYTTPSLPYTHTYIQQWHSLKQHQDSSVCPL